MNEPKDKRTKAWKQWKKDFDKDKDNSIGIGDVVEKITEKTGVKKAVKFIAGDDCGCNKRKEALNAIPFRFPVVRCFTETQYNQWGVFRNKKVWTHKDQVDVLIPVFSQLFARQLKPMSCCINPYIKDIDKVYNQYQ